MTEILTGKQLRERADAVLAQRKPDKESIRNWIQRGADRIDKLTAEVNRLESNAEAGGGSEAAMMMLEDARSAADNTLARVKEMEADAESALERASADADKVANEIIGKAHAEAAEIIASGRETAKEHMAKTEEACQLRLDRAVERAQSVDQSCRDLVEQARALERTYRKRVSDIRAEAKALVGLMDRFDSLPITADEDKLDDEELLAEIVDLTAASEARDRDNAADADADADGRDLDGEGDELVDANEEDTADAEVS